LDALILRHRRLWGGRCGRHRRVRTEEEGCPVWTGVMHVSDRALGWVALPYWQVSCTFDITPVFTQLCEIDLTILVPQMNKTEAQGAR
jgi:hypothetical protein